VDTNLLCIKKGIKILFGIFSNIVYHAKTRTNQCDWDFAMHRDGVVSRGDSGRYKLMENLKCGEEKE